MDFESEVIEKSHIKPVLVDFWAPWCGPCRMLGPTLDQLATEQKERLELVKVNTEEEQELASRYKIQGIPNVKLFYKGTVLAEFSGALPKGQIEKWLDTHLPDPRVDWLKEILGNGSEAEVSRLHEAIQNEPHWWKGILVYGQLVFRHAPQEALPYLKRIPPGTKEYDLALDLIVLCELMMADFNEANPVEAVLKEAQLQIATQRDESAIQSLIQATAIDKKYKGDLPRKACIAYFHLWGEEDARTIQFRKPFERALW